MLQNTVPFLLAVAYGVIVINSGEATMLSTDLKGCVVISNPTCPDQDYIKFYLFTRHNPNTPDIVTSEPDNLNTTFFKAADPTKVIIHGYADNSTNIFLIDLKNQYLIKGGHNVIMVDWSRLCEGIQCYQTSKTSAQHVGACLAGLIQRLRSAAATDIHVIGHSLGGQTAGMAANFLKPYLLPRITGLDPAGPYYELVTNDKKLDSTDAIFVEILHSNILEYGIAAPSGHVDYYFNGGKNQPGCGLPVLTLICSHLRAIMYYAESLNNAKGFYGWQCPNFASYFAGFCWQKPRTIRLGDETNRGIVSIPTASSSFYALGQ